MRANWGDLAGDIPRGCAIHVPFHERHIVKALGCKWSCRLQQWFCTQRQFHQKSFARYRSKQFVTTQVFVGFNEIAQAKQIGCYWVRAPQKRWVFDVPKEGPCPPWILERLKPLEVTRFRVPYDQRKVATLDPIPPTSCNT